MRSPTSRSVGSAWFGGRLATVCARATATRHSAVVKLARCNRRSKLQQWRPTRLLQLYNPGAHRCLDDPSGGDKPGLILTAGACRAARPQTWFKP